MKIRNYLDKDKENVRKICLETCLDETLKNRQEALYLLYADYYINEHSEDILIAADDNDDVVGYVLCCTDAKKYVKDFKRGYLAELSTIDKALYLNEKKQLKNYTLLKFLGFPAHLHIDLTESAQRMGVGTKLLDELFLRLAAKNVNGLWLGCSLSNEKGNAFYQKYGFNRLGVFGDGVVYTMKIKTL